MSIDEYYANISKELKSKSDSMKIGFSTHRLSAGENREDIFGDFLKHNLPKSFGVGTGLILSSEGEFSSQADLVIVDHLNNAPLYPDSRNKLWLVESIYALIEVKTDLNPSDIQDSIKRCIKFKRLKREFQTVPAMPRIAESLFIVWAFNGPASETLKNNIASSYKDIAVDDQPDIIIIPDSILITAGSFRRLSKFGMPGTDYQQNIIEKNQGKSYLEIFGPTDFWELKDNSLLIFLTWLTAWLKGAGVRSAPLEVYLERGKIFGYKI
jgi:hypothetical protein